MNPTAKNLAKALRSYAFRPINFNWLASCGECEQVLVG
jgi:hypothetical protein